MRRVCLTVDAGQTSEFYLSISHVAEKYASLSIFLMNKSCFGSVRKPEACVPAPFVYPRQVRKLFNELKSFLKSPPSSIPFAIAFLCA